MRFFQCSKLEHHIGLSVRNMIFLVYRYKSGAYGHNFLINLKEKKNTTILHLRKKLRFYQCSKLEHYIRLSLRNMIFFSIQIHFLGLRPQLFSNTKNRYYIFNIILYFNIFKSILKFLFYKKSDFLSIGS